MKFNEKLIDLRKKAGLSQEELGYKLNVTRQTVSKWELAQTTPEMDKLKEISKIFNVSVDELINESETQEVSKPIVEEKAPDNRPNNKQSGREKFIKILLVVVLIVVLALIAIKVYEIASNKWEEIQQQNAKEQEREDKFYDTIFDTFDNINQSTDEISDNFENGHQSIEDNYNENKEEIFSQFEVKKFNQPYELHSGTNKGLFVTNILDSIITSNKTEDRKIIVKYQDTETQDEAEIRNIKQKIKTMNDYDVAFEYDEEGFVNKAQIENL